jgi:hypothetical protein
MPFKFRKSYKIAPGVRLNVGKKGMSTSIGGKGSTINVGKKGVKHTASIPGTGMSYTTGSGNKKKSSGCGSIFLLFTSIGLTAWYLISLTSHNP